MADSGSKSNPRLMTVTEVAEALACSESNVYALIEAGELPFVQIGRAKGYRIDAEDLRIFISERKKQKRCVRPNASRTNLKHIKI